MAAPALKRATYADLEALPETLVGEIVDGQLEARPRPRPQHVVASTLLGRRLGTRYDDGIGGPGGWIFMAEPELHLGPHVVVPDLAGWRRDRFPFEVETAFIEVAPDLICEILSPSTQRLDRGAKRRIYAEFGVAHLWLLEPNDGVLEAFALTGGHWLLVSTIERGEEVRAAPFDASPFPFDDLFPLDPPPSTEA